MKYLAYIYIKDNVLRTALHSNINAIENFKKQYPKGEIFVIETNNNDEEWVLEKPIQDMYTLIKIIYRHYFFLNRYYTNLLTEEVLYRALKEVREEYDERATNIN